MDQSNHEFREHLYLLLLHLRTSQLLVQNVMNHPLAQGKLPGDVGTPEQQIGHKVKEVFQKADWFVGKSLQLIGDPDLRERLEESDEQIVSLVNLLQRVAGSPTDLTDALEALSSPSFNKDTYREAFMEGLSVGAFARTTFDMWYGRKFPQTKSHNHEPVR